MCASKYGPCAGLCVRKSEGCRGGERELIRRRLVVDVGRAWEAFGSEMGEKRGAGLKPRAYTVASQLLRARG